MESFGKRTIAPWSLTYRVRPPRPQCTSRDGAGGRRGFALCRGQIHPTCASWDRAHDAPSTRSAAPLVADAAALHA